MGTFRYHALLVEIADEELALLEAVMRTMSERGEGFMASFASRRGESHQAPWMHPGAPTRFSYSLPIDLDRLDSWHLDLLLACANSEDGIVLEAS